MKNYASILLSLIVILVFSESQVFGQLPWTKDVNNPVLTGGSSGTWNRHLIWPHVIYNDDSTRYEMWFSSLEGPTAPYPGWRPSRIGFATSADGIDWTMHPDPVLEPDAGSWDETSVEGAMVIREENGQYKMWYEGWSPSNGLGGIGYATSADGITWTKYLDNPVMVPGSAAWQAGFLSSPNVFPFEEGYKMWYTGWNAGETTSNIGYATSPDGINWTSDTLNNPVLETGSSGRWDDGNLVIPNVLLIDNVYHMWYTGMPPNWGLPRKIGWATSTDGINWNKYNDPNTTSTLYLDSDPVLITGSGEWDEAFVEGATVMHKGDSLIMWYSGSRSSVPANLNRIGHATAPYDTSIKIVNGIEDNISKNLPHGFALLQNYPNPFNPVTAISYQLSAVSDVELSVYNLLGQKVASLVYKSQQAGYHQVEWDASQFSSGVYYYRIEAGEFQDVKKMILIK